MLEVYPEMVGQLNNEAFAHVLETLNFGIHHQVKLQFLLLRDTKYILVAFSICLELTSLWEEISNYIHVLKSYSQ